MGRVQHCREAEPAGADLHQPACPPDGVRSQGPRLRRTTAGAARRLPRGCRRPVSTAHLRSGRVHGESRGVVGRSFVGDGDQWQPDDGRLHVVNRERCGMEGLLLIVAAATDFRSAKCRHASIVVSGLAFRRVPFSRRYAVRKQGAVPVMASVRQVRRSPLYSSEYPSRARTVRPLGAESVTLILCHPAALVGRRLEREQISVGKVARDAVEDVEDFGWFVDSEGEAASGFRDAGQLIEQPGVAQRGALRGGGGGRGGGAGCCGARAMAVSAVRTLWLSLPSVNTTMAFFPARPARLRFTRTRASYKAVAPPAPGGGGGGGGGAPSREGGEG